MSTLAIQRAVLRLAVMTLLAAAGSWGEDRLGHGDSREFFQDRPNGSAGKSLLNMSRKIRSLHQ